MKGQPLAYETTGFCQWYMQAASESLLYLKKPKTVIEKGQEKYKKAKWTHEKMQKDKKIVVPLNSSAICVSLCVF